MLEVKNLYASYDKKTKFNSVENIKILKDISLSVREGESVGIVGESGSGKSTLANCIMGIKKADSGHIIFKDSELYNLSNKKFDKNIRKDIQMVFQNPYSSLNPKIRVGKIIGEILTHYKLASKSNVDEKTIEILESVNLSSEYMDRFPRELSGGQRQRISIARAIAAEPKLLILDEPTSALDLLIQKDILELMQDLRENMNLTYVFISHDLEVVKHICDRIIIMENGAIVEEGTSSDIFYNPKESYTKKLIDSIPKNHPLD